ncbi:MAG: flagellar hook-length control protein FliK [Oxalobacteraceae bacterium]|nr:flagellar hook-length control protein FliK [Oxalobacteraceae bacterium]
MLARQVANRSDDSLVKKVSADTDRKKTPDSASKTGPDAVPAEAGNEIEKADEVSQNPTDATPSATAELLALVANIRQPAEKPDDAVADNDALPKVDGDLDPAVGKGKRPNSGPDRALLENLEMQDRRHEGAGKPAPDVIQNLDKKGDTRLLTDAATLKIQDPQSTTTVASIAASQTIAQEIGQAEKNPAADRLTPAVGSNAWNQALGQKITLMVGATQQTATLSLNPPDLGPLQVVLNINKDSADATFIAAQPEVRQALEAALPRLREMMNEAGIQLGQANVSSNMPDQNNAQNGSGSRMGAQASRDSAQSEDASTITQPANRTMQLGLIDAFA